MEQTKLCYCEQVWKTLPFSKFEKMNQQEIAVISGNGYSSETRPDIVVSFLNTDAPKRIAANLHIPVIERPPGWNGHSGFNKSLFDLVVCESETFRSELLNRQEYCAHPGRTRVVFNGANLQKFAVRDKASARDRLKISRDVRMVLALNRIHPVKNLPMQVRGIKYAIDQGLNIELHIVGRASLIDEIEEREVLNRLIADLGVTTRVLFHDYVADPSDYIAAADVVALTSFTEGAPNALIEAMAMGKPIVSTKVGAIDEITQGLATFVTDSQSYGLALLNSTYKEVTYPNFAARFDIKATSREWENIFEEVACKSNRNLIPRSSRTRIAFLCENLNIGGMENVCKNL